MIIIFGVKPRYTTIASGQFWCPHCQAARAYEQRRARNWFTLYFIPLIPLNALGEVVTCTTCGLNFAPDVLTQTPRAATPMDRIVRDARADLDGGTPIEFVRQKLINTGLARELVDETIAQAAGPDRKICPDDHLTYRGTVERCAQCGRVLNLAGR